MVGYNLKERVQNLWIPDKVYEKDSFGYVGGEFLRFKIKRPNIIGVDVSIKGTENDPIY